MVPSRIFLMGGPEWVHRLIRLVERGGGVQRQFHLEDPLHLIQFYRRIA